MDALISKGVDYAQLPFQKLIGQIKNPAIQGEAGDLLRKFSHTAKDSLPQAANGIIDAISKKPASPVDVINKQSQSLIDRINKKPLTAKTKFGRFFQKIGRGIAKAGVRVSQGVRHGVNWLRNNKIGKWVGRGVKAAVSSIPGAGGVIGNVAANMVLGRD